MGLCCLSSTVNSWSALGGEKFMSEITKVDKDMVIGEIITKFPDAEKIIEKYFGGGCFTCPGIKVESISFGAMMHNIDADVVVNEINASLEK